MLVIGEVVEATVMFWAWGRGHPKDGQTAAVAFIHEGWDQQQLGWFAEAAFDPEAERTVVVISHHDAAHTGP